MFSRCVDLQEWEGCVCVWTQVEVGIQKYNWEIQTGFENQVGRCAYVFVWMRACFPGHQLAVAQRLWNSTEVWCMQKVYLWIHWMGTEGWQIRPGHGNRIVRHTRRRPSWGGQRRGQKEGWEVQQLTSQGTIWLVQLPCRVAGASTFCVAQKGLSLDPAGCWVRGLVLTTSHCKDPGTYS